MKCKQCKNTTNDSLVIRIDKHCIREYCPSCNYLLGVKSDANIMRRIIKLRGIK